MNDTNKSCKNTLNANKSIGCTVTQCKHHCCGENYCTLNKIEIVTHEANPTVSQCTDCSSFAPKN